MTSGGAGFQRAVIVAMVAMHVVQATVDKIIEMIPVRNGGMSAVRAVDMLGLVPFRPVRTAIGIGSRHFDDMLDCNVPAADAVAVLAVLMPVGDAHGKFLVDVKGQTHEVPGKVPLRG